MKSLLEAFFDLPSANQYWLAYSGGLDSEVLLTVLATEFPELAVKAIHIHHGLSPHATTWEEHCRHRCKILGVPLISQRVQLNLDSGESLEANARHARYQVFQSLLGPGDVLMMAHHQDDQAETFLLQALRGAGIQGLSAMPRFRAPYYRPWLSVSRDEIQAYADEHQLVYIQDESNFDTSFDRNFLRHRIIPELEQRWPRAKKTLSRSANLAAESQRLLESYLQNDYQEIRYENGTLSVARLLEKSAEHQRALIRYWIQLCDSPLPSEAIINRIIEDLLEAKPDAMPVVQWQSVECRRFQDQIFCLKQQVDPPKAWRATWDFSQPLILPEGLGMLVAFWDDSGGLVVPGKSVEVCFRQGGESILKKGHAHHHTLKNCWQEWGIPPWQRNKIPLIKIDNTIAMVVGREIFSGHEGKPGWRIEWTGYR